MDNGKNAVMNLQELIKTLPEANVTGNTDIEVRSLQFDSRQIGPGDVFVATRGTAVDGHLFIGKAIEAGAVACVCEQIPEDDQEKIPFVVVRNSQEALGRLASCFYGYPSRHLTLVGVTGTNGKTTIATLLWKLTRAMGHKAGLLSTVCNYIEEEAVPATHTTPDALVLNKLLRQMVDAGCE